MAEVSPAGIELVVHCTRETLDGALPGTEGTLEWRDGGDWPWSEIPLDAEGVGRANIDAKYQFTLRYTSPVGVTKALDVPVGRGVEEVRSPPGVTREDGKISIRIVVEEFALVRVELLVSPDDDAEYFALVLEQPCAKQVETEALGEALRLKAGNRLGYQEAEVHLPAETDRWIGVYRADGSLVQADPRPFHMKPNAAIAVLFQAPIVD